jgi:hypothetical protein
MGKLFHGALVVLLGGVPAAVLLCPYTCGCGHGHRRSETAKMQIMKLQTAIEMFRQQRKRLPASLQDLTVSTPDDPEPYLEAIDKDPWGNAFEYRPGERGRFSLHSRGPDGRAGTDDDLVWPEPGEPAPGRAGPPPPGQGPHPGGG